MAHNRVRAYLDGHPLAPLRGRSDGPPDVWRSKCQAMRDLEEEAPGLLGRVQLATVWPYQDQVQLDLPPQQ